MKQQLVQALIKKQWDGVDRVSAILDTMDGADRDALQLWLENIARQIQGEKLENVFKMKWALGTSSWLQRLFSFAPYSVVTDGGYSLGYKRHGYDAWVIEDAFTPRKHLLSDVRRDDISVFEKTAPSGRSNIKINYQHDIDTEQLWLQLVNEVESHA